MKRFPQPVQVLAAGLILLAHGACGGGGGGQTAGSATSGGTNNGGNAPVGSMVSLGAITAKGSIFVNGIEFSTTNATVKIDGSSALASDLKIGMVVKVRGDRDSGTRKGTANLVEARDALEGTIDLHGIDGVNKTLTVMGQTVRIEDSVTRLNDDDIIKVFSAAGFQEGDRVEIHGFPDDQGGLRATRVVKKTSGEFEVKGFVRNLAATSFDLSLVPGGAPAVTVTFNAGLLPTGTVNGSFVEVKALAAPVTGSLVASFIELEDQLGAAGDKAEVEGIVTSGTVDDFMVGGQRVVTSAATVFEGGLKTDLAVGTMLEVEGALGAGGAIAAAKISFRSSIKIEADVSSVASDGLTVLGKAVAINAFTRIDQGPLAAGDHVEIRATTDRDGNLIASRIIKLSASSRVFLQGPVTAYDAGAGTMTMLGLVIATDSRTEFRTSTDTAESAVAQTVFFAQVVPGVTVVKVRWDAFTSLAVPVKQAEIEMGK